MPDSKNIIIINGPNLNLLGVRQTDVYGNKSLDELVLEIKDNFSDHHIEHFQTNHEGTIIDLLHKYGFNADGIVLNAGAYTHTSIAIADAIRAINTPVVELHISNIYEREEFRRQSFIQAVCIHHIIGQGTQGYDEAVRYLLALNSHG